MIDNGRRGQKAGELSTSLVSFDGANLCHSAVYIDAPALPLQDDSILPPKDPKREMEDFLDDLLT